MAVWSTVNLSALAGNSRLDAEFYQPVYISNDQLLRSQKWAPLSSLVTSLRKGVFYILAEEYVAEGVPFYRSSNVGPILTREEELVYITPSKHTAEAKTAVGYGDLILAKTGREGASIVLRQACNVSQDVIAVVPNREAINPFYLAVFLNTRYGMSGMRRWFQGQVQLHLSLPDARLMPIPLAPESVQVAAESLVRKAQAILAEGGNSYQQAEDELLQRMQWQSVVSVSRRTSFISSFHQLSKAARFDAEHFEPRFQRLVTHLQAKGAQQVRDFCPRPVRGVQPEFAPTGTVLVIDSKSVRPDGVRPTIDERTSEAFYSDERNSRARVQRGDVLLNSTGRGTLGRAACYQQDAAAIADNHVSILRPSPSICDPMYLALFLNSPAGLWQTEQYQCGSSGQIELYPHDIQKLWVFLPKAAKGKTDLKWQHELADKIARGASARARAEAALERAKQLVERWVQTGDVG